jgi:hypothetical protein
MINAEIPTKNFNQFILVICSFYFY